MTISAAAKRLRLDSTSSTISSSEGADVLNLLQQQKQHFVGQVTTTAMPIGQEQPIKLKKDIIESSKLKKGGCHWLSTVNAQTAGILLFVVALCWNANIEYVYLYTSVDGGVQESKSKVTSSQDDRRHLANMLHIATSGDNVPASTRRSLAENIMALFDQRNATIAVLMQVCERFFAVSWHLQWCVLVWIFWVFSLFVFSCMTPNICWVIHYSICFAFYARSNLTVL